MVSGGFERLERGIPGRLDPYGEADEQTVCRPTTFWFQLQLEHSFVLGLLQVEILLRVVVRQTPGTPYSNYRKTRAQDVGVGFPKAQKLSGRKWSQALPHQRLDNSVLAGRKINSYESGRSNLSLPDEIVFSAISRMQDPGIELVI